MGKKSMVWLDEKIDGMEEVLLGLSFAVFKDFI